MSSFCKAEEQTCRDVRKKKVPLPLKAVALALALDEVDEEAFVVVAKVVVDVVVVVGAAVEVDWDEEGTAELNAAKDGGADSYWYASVDLTLVLDGVGTFVVVVVLWERAA